MALYPGATWRPSPNHGGPLAKSVGVILHVEAGTEAGTCQVFSEASYQASAHFGVAKDGHIDQFVDSALEAWAQAAGNGSYFSIETEGYPTEPLTDAQVAAFAKLYVWLKGQPNAAFGFTLAEVPGQPGLGWHGMGGAAWGGHTGCPGDLRKAQRQTILNLAQPAPPAPAPTMIVGSSYEVDVTVTPISVTIATDGSGNGWTRVPYQIDKIVGVLAPGLRPAVDGRYLDGAVAFAQEDPNTVVSLVGWAPNSSTVVRLRVAS